MLVIVLRSDFAVIGKFHPLTFKTILIDPYRLSLQATAMHTIPSLLYFRKYHIVGSPDDISVAYKIFLFPAPAGWDATHLAVEHGKRNWGVIDKLIKIQFIRAQRFSFLFKELSIQRLKGKHVEGSIPD